MTTHVFVGPSLSSDEVLARLPEAVIHPPIGHGDPFRLNTRPGDTVAVIDGLFFQSTAVRHKEILWLLARGVRVVGASSMGALRAAELDRFGMRGVGQVYRAFADGQLDADDEVAVVHADAEDGWINHSDALVNLRTAAARATDGGILRSEDAATFIEVARGLYFPQRRATQIVRLCAMEGALETNTAEAFLTWLGTNTWDAKAEDARLLLDELARGSHEVRAPDDADWPIGELPGFVHDWSRDLITVDDSGTTAGDVEALLRLFAVFDHFAGQDAAGPVQQPDGAEPRHALTFEPGDVFSMPAGHPHQATASESWSMHVSIAVKRADPLAELKEEIRSAVQQASSLDDPTRLRAAVVDALNRPLRTGPPQTMSIGRLDARERLLSILRRE